MSSLDKSQDVATVLHLEKLKGLACAQEYAVTHSNRFSVVTTLEDALALHDTFMGEALEDAMERQHEAAITWKRGHDSWFACRLECCLAVWYYAP